MSFLWYVSRWWDFKNWFGTLGVVLSWEKTSTLGSAISDGVKRFVAKISSLISILLLGRSNSEGASGVRQDDCPGGPSAGAILCCYRPQLFKGKPRDYSTLLLYSGPYGLPPSSPTPTPLLLLMDAQSWSANLMVDGTFSPQTRAPNLLLQSRESGGQACSNPVDATFLRQRRQSRQCTFP